METSGSPRLYSLPARDLQKLSLVNTKENHNKLFYKEIKIMHEKYYKNTIKTINALKGTENLKKC